MQQKLKDKQVEGKPYKKKEKVQKKKALDERDFNILGQLSQLNKSVVVIDEQRREVEEKEKELEKKELEQRERELQRKEGERNKENCLNSKEVILIFATYKERLQDPHADESDKDKRKTKSKISDTTCRRKLRTGIKNFNFNATKFTIYLMIITSILCSCLKICKHMLSCCHIHNPQSCALF